MGSKFKLLRVWLLREAASLRSAIILAVLAGVAIPTSIASYADRQRLKEQFATQMKTDLRNSSELLTGGIKEAVWVFAKEDVDAIINTAFGDKRIVSIAVLDKSGQRFASRSRQGIDPAQVTTLSTEMMREDKKVGTLIVSMDGESYRQQLNEGLEKDVIRALQTLIGSLVLIILLLHARLAIPIRRLVAAAWALEKGNLTRPIAIGRRDELGQLARSMEATRKALSSLFEELEQRVQQRTSALSKSNEALSSANDELLDAYKAAASAQHQATQALEELRATQTQLVQSEKMAALGQVIAGVAHEINTPIGAIKSSGQNIIDALAHSLIDMPRLFQILSADKLELFVRMINRASRPTPVLSSREERTITREAGRQLEAAGIIDASYKAAVLVQLHAQDVLADYLPLLRDPECDLILHTASGVATIINNTSNINVAVDRVSKIVFALKSFSHTDHAGELLEANVCDGLETVLTIYQRQIKQGTELIRQYEDIPPLRCLPDELNQVWINLIHNALQAMDNRGTLTIGVCRSGGEARVTVGDTGCGIPEAIRSKIFDPFFTTRPAGEGSGLGLDIVKKIVDKHKGRIEVQSAVGVGTTFSVFLPFATAGAGSVTGVPADAEP